MIEPADLVNSERLREVSFGCWVVPEVVNWPIEEYVVVRVSALEETLRVTQVGVQRWDVVPKRVPWIDLARCVEAPPRPRGFWRRICCAMPHDVIGAGEKELVAELFEPSERFVEVLGCPGSCFRTRDWFARGVRGARCEFRDKDVCALEIEFGFGNVALRVNVEPVSRRAVGLIARDESVFVRPSGPSSDGVCNQLGNGFPIIRTHACGAVGVAAIFK